MRKTPLKPDAMRAASPDELRTIPWLDALADVDRRRTEAALRVRDCEPGQSLCRRGGRPAHWIGVVDGLLKMSKDAADGRSFTYAGLPPGGWFSEGTLLKRDCYRYDIQALRRSRVALLPVEDFHWLLDHSLGFNRFVMSLLNERLGQFIASSEADRRSDPDARVANHLLALFNPALCPGVGSMLRITQQELAYLVGLSRQRVNEALRRLEDRGAIRVEYGGVRMLERGMLHSA